MIGLRQGLSCQDDLSRFSMDIETSFSKQEYVMCGFAGIMDAYNGISIEVLISRLLKFGADIHLCRYINNFLDNRIISYELANGKEVLGCVELDQHKGARCLLPYLTLLQYILVDYQTGKLKQFSTLMISYESIAVTKTSTTVLYQCKQP